MKKINDFNEAKNLLEKYLDKKISINKLKKNYFIDDGYNEIYKLTIDK